MKDKEKQIEEMREHICIGCSGKPCGEYCDKCKFVAEELLKHYQLKLPEDSIMLTREEYDSLKLEIQQAHNKGVRVGFDLKEFKINSIKQKASKETAEKILNFIDSEDIGFSCERYRLKQLLKEQFGVEIKE